MNKLTTLLNIRNIQTKFYSTVQKLVPESDANTELDKLYKTLELEVRGHDPAVLRSYCKFAVSAGNHLGLNAKTWSLKKPFHDRHTVLKSVHIYKKHRVQYEFRTYFAFVQYYLLTGSTADTLLEYVERNLPEGVSLKATKVQVHELPEHIRNN